MKNSIFRKNPVQLDVMDLSNVRLFGSPHTAIVFLAYPCEEESTCLITRSNHPNCALKSGEYVSIWDYPALPTVHTICYILRVEPK